jgi:Sigma-70 region 2
MTVTQTTTQRKLALFRRWIGGFASKLSPISGIKRHGMCLKASAPEAIASGFACSFDGSSGVAPTRREPRCTRFDVRVGLRLCRLMDDTDLLDFVDGLYGYAMTITRNPTDAEDLVQETYLRAIPRMRSLRPESNLKRPEKKQRSTRWFL